MWTANAAQVKANQELVQTAKRLLAPGGTRAAGDGQAAPGGEIVTVTQDRVEISHEAWAAQRAQEKREALEAAAQARAAERESLAQQAEAAAEEADAAAEAYGDLGKCILIASRIMAGDKVPPEDHKFLREHDPEMYEQAITLRQEKERPEKHRRLSEDEGEEGETGEDPGSRDWLESMAQHAQSPSPHPTGGAGAPRPAE